MATKQRKSLSDTIWGSPEDFSLENRIFNAVCFQVIICVVIATLENILLDNPVNQTIATVSAFVLGSISYCFSRFLRLYFFTNIIGVAAFMCLLAFVWLGSGGVVGSMPYTLFILMVATVIIVPARYKLFMIALQFFVFFILFLLEYLMPSWVVHYRSYSQQFFDMVIFLCMSLIIVTTIVHIVFMHYIREKEIKENLLSQTIKDKEKIEKAFLEIKQLQGIIPICSSCKRVRNDKGYWEQVENYIHNHSEAEFTHGLCPECIKKLYSMEQPSAGKARGFPE